MTLRAPALTALALSLFLVAPASAATTGSMAAGDWVAANRDVRSTHYSPLTGIRKDNVAHLRPACTYDLHESVQFQDAPIAVNGVLYAATFDNTYAIDGATCRLLWRFKRPIASIPGFGSIRGLGYDNGRIYVATYDGHLIALHASTGRTLWDTRVLQAGSGGYFVAAPLAVDGLVFIGNAGSDVGALGHMFALEQSTGHIVWTVPLVATGDPQTSQSWGGAKGRHIAGGGTWTSYSYDPERRLLYVPVGNPGPDFDGDYRPGANLYTDSVMALDAKTGALRAWHQLVPHDTHDWDVSTPPALVSTHEGNEQIDVVGKDGYLYLLSRDLSTILHKVPTTTMLNGSAPLTRAGTRFCPGTQGGTEFNAVAYSRSTNLLYVPAVDWCSTIKLASKTTYVPGQPFLGSANGFGTLDPVSRGWLVAVDADSGRIAWKWRAPTPLLAAVVPTAGGLLFTGDLNGNVMAFDAARGTLLYRHHIPGPIPGGLATYAAGGKQYLAVVSGFPGGIWHRPKTTDRIVIFSLGPSSP